MLFYVDVGALREDAARLLNSNPAVECALKLHVHGLCFRRRLILQRGNRRYVGQCLTELEVLVGKGDPVSHEDFHRSGRGIS